MINGGLFTHDFLIEGIRETEPWATLTDGCVGNARVRALALFQRLSALKTPTEAVTEKDFIYPVCQTLAGAISCSEQPNASVKGRADVPDALLFADELSTIAKKESEDFRRFQHGLRR